MGKKVPGGSTTRSMTVRIPEDVYVDLVAVAAARGMDLSAVVNHILADARPGLLQWLYQHRRGLEMPASAQDRIEAVTHRIVTSIRENLLSQGEAGKQRFADDCVELAAQLLESGLDSDPASVEARARKGAADWAGVDDQGWADAVARRAKTQNERPNVEETNAESKRRVEDQ